MVTYTVKAPDGNTYSIDGPDGATDEQVRAQILAAHPEAAKPAAPKPPGYDKAMAQIAAQDQATRARNLRYGGPIIGGLQNASQDFIRQVADKSGAQDEFNGGLAYLTQGATNLFRRATGQTIDVPAASAAKAAIDYERQQQAQYAQQHPTANVFAAAANIATMARPTGAGILTNPFRAGAAAAVQRAPFALASQQGDVQQRLPGAALDTATAFGLGTVLTAGANALAQSGARAAANPSAARQLSDRGVQLTPGQMAGGLAKRAEDAATSLPITGAAINAARNQGVESFNRAALDQSLAPIGAKLPSTVDAGREGLSVATGMISDAYDAALQGVHVAPDAAYRAQVQAAVASVPKSVRGDVQAVAQDALQRMRGGTTGDAWKALDADLGAAYRAADNASQSAPVQRFVRNAIAQIQQAHGDLLARTSPEAAAGVGAADAATANLVRIRQASQNAATAGRGGVFLPSELNMAVRSMDTTAGNRAFATGRAPLQDLTEPAMQVLPNKIADSGTAGRLMSAGAIYGGTGALGGPHMGLGALAGDAALSVAYSKPVQAAINAIYRAKGPGEVRYALAVLSAAAARDPALVPAYTAALRRLGLAPASSASPPAQPAGQPVTTTP